MYNSETTGYSEKKMNVEDKQFEKYIVAHIFPFYAQNASCLRIFVENCVFGHNMYFPFLFLPEKSISQFISICHKVVDLEMLVPRNCLDSAIKT